jgi:TRAP-type mannitol/chloroaromatic compound transport system substrate-binding protein
MTGGKFQIQVFASGELMPSFGVFDGVSVKTVEAGHTASFYFVGKDPAFAFDTIMPSGLSEVQQRLWFSENGELPLIRTLFQTSNIYNIPCGRMGGSGQWTGWSWKEIRSLQDMQGLKYRVTGLDGKVFQRIGATPLAIAGGELSPALQKGVIDMAQWSGPYDSERLGLHKVAPYFYKPLAHRSFSSLSLYVNLDEWRRLPAEYQRVLKQSCEKASDDSDNAYRQRDTEALSRLAANGATVREMPKDVERAFEREAELQNEELAAGNENFRKLYGAWKRFKAR